MRTLTVRRHDITEILLKVALNTLNLTVRRALITSTSQSFDSATTV
jgi:hypothetical protein